MFANPELNLDEKVEPESGLEQTRFASEEPLFESAQLPTEPRDPASAPKKKNLVLISGVLFISLLALVGAALLASRPMTNVTQLQPSPSPSPVVISPQVQTQLEKLQAELESADPARSTLTFPQVDGEIRLDPPPKGR